MDEFQSHSIHYIMLAARSTEEAKEFTNQQNDIASLEAIGRAKKLGDAIVTSQSNNTAYLVMDTRRFSQFSIDHLEYDILLNGLESKTAPGNFINTLNMTLLDSVGVSFINFMQWLMNEKMQCNFDGMIFILKVLFVGQNADGTHTTIQSVNIPMHLHKMNLDLTYAKGAYQIEFMPNTNFDTIKHSRWLQIASSSTYSTPKGSNKLGDMVDSFETTLNKNSSDYYAKTKALRANSGVDTSKNFGRLVKYQITLPTEWRDFEYAGSGTGDATERVYTKNDIPTDSNPNPSQGKAAQATDSQYSASSGDTITNVLERLLQQTPSIAKMGLGVYDKTKSNTVSFVKYLVGVTSTNDSMTIHVDVVPFEVPNVKPNDEKDQKKGIEDGKFYQMVDNKRVPKNYYEFDYIYTGKNNDILEFDMKFQDLQWMLASNLDMGAGAFLGANPGGDTKDTKKTESGDSGKVNKVSELVLMRAYDPLLPPTTTQSEYDNFSQFSSLLDRKKESDLIKTTQLYTRNLAMFYACTAIKANITIRGNPDIMAKFNIPSFLPQPGESSDTPVSGRNNSSKQAYRIALEKEILGKAAQEGKTTAAKTGTGFISVSPLNIENNYVNSPVFFKVNVKGPNVDWMTAETVQGEDFATDILGDSYFVVMKLKNVIDGPNFTQQIEMYTHNVFGGPTDDLASGAEKAMRKE